MADFNKYVIIVMLVTVTYKITHSSGNNIKVGKAYSAGDHLYLFCFGEALENTTFLPLHDIGYISVVYLEGCAATQLPYATILQRLNVTTSTINSLILSDYNPTTSEKSPLSERNFEDLNIRALKIQNGRNARPQSISTELLIPLVNLTYLELINVDSPPLPEFSQVEELILDGGKFQGVIGGCTKLHSLRLYNWNIDLASEFKLANCSNLKTLELGRIRSLSTVLRKLIEGVASLQRLKIRSCNLVDIPTIILNNGNIKELYIERETFRNFSLSNLRMKSLDLLSLSYLHAIELQGVPPLRMQEFKLTLDNTPILAWKFQKSDFEMLDPKVPIIIESDSMLQLDCDCRHGWLIRAIRENHIHLYQPLFTPPPQCADGTKLAKVSQNTLECDRYNCNDCTCRRLWSDNKVAVHCTGNITRVPHIRNLYSLQVADNQIDTISRNDLPDTLLSLDLRGNRISTLDSKTIAALFSVKERRVSLSGNPISCHCANRQLVEALQAHQTQIEDYEVLYCIDSQYRRLLRYIGISELCAAEYQKKEQLVLTVILAILVTLLAIGTIGIIVYMNFKQQIKMFLYSRGCCMCCIRENGIDPNLRYDAFLSFSHKDDSLVLEELVPRLDNEYKMCLHYRDWMVGEFIPAQINRSVEESQRTIIVLSRNYMESAWALLEFRTAHENSLGNGRGRLIVVVLDDIIDDVENLPPMIRRYVKANAYIRWGDSWFWEKLRYAMPHSSLSTEPIVQPTDSDTTNNEEQGIEMTPPTQTVD